MLHVFAFVYMRKRRCHKYILTRYNRLLRVAIRLEVCAFSFVSLEIHSLEYLYLRKMTRKQVYYILEAKHTELSTYSSLPYYKLKENNTLNTDVEIVERAKWIIMWLE